MQKTLATKLASFKESLSRRSFILADAKDADMAFGIAAPGRARDGRYLSPPEFRDQIREIIAQGLVDIMLMFSPVRQRYSQSGSASSITPL
jgi:hypothetical protein